jgi:hypothetical protein
VKYVAGGAGATLVENPKTIIVPVVGRSVILPTSEATVNVIAV